MNAPEAMRNAPIKEVVAFHTNAPKSESERKQGQNEEVCITRVSKIRGTIFNELL